MTEHRAADIRGRKRMISDFPKNYENGHLVFTDEDMDRVDFYMTGGSRTYVGDIKNYDNPKHIRPYSKFIKEGKDYGYQLDYDKLEEIEERASADNRTPLLVAYFHDCRIIWDIGKVDWRSRARMKTVNKDGMHYGEEKETALQTYLFKNEAVNVVEYE